MTVNNFDVRGMIQIAPNNFMTARFDLSGNHYSDLQSTLFIRAYSDKDIDSTITIRSMRESDLDSSFNVMRKGNSEIHANIQAIEGKFLDSTLFVRPHNGMSAVFDIIAPIQITDVLSPIKDSTVRSLRNNAYINYGNYSTMMVGTQRDEYFGSYIQFDLNQYPQTLSILEAKLRVYFSVSMDDDVIELYETDRNWDEYGITYANRPLLTNLISDKYTINRQSNYIEFDLLDYVRDVVNNGQSDFGIGAISTNSSLYTLFTKESSFKPTLSLTYFDTRITSAGRADLIGTLFAFSQGSSDLRGYLNVRQHADDNDLTATMHVHTLNEVLESSRTAILVSSKPDLNSTITIYQSGISDLWSFLIIRNDDISEKESLISVSKPDLIGTLYYKYQNYLDSTLTARTSNNSIIDGLIRASSPDLHGSIFVNPSTDLNGFLVVQRNIISSIDSTINISKPEVSSILYVKYHNDLNGVMSVISGDVSDTDSLISVSIPELNATIITYARENSDLNAYLSVSTNFSNNIESLLGVSRPELTSTMIAKVEASIRSRVSVSNPEMISIVAVRGYTENDLEAFISPRLISVSDLSGTLQGLNRHKGGAYYFII